MALKSLNASVEINSNNRQLNNFVVSVTNDWRTSRFSGSKDKQLKCKKKKFLSQCHNNRNRLDNARKKSSKIIRIKKLKQNCFSFKSSFNSHLNGIFFQSPNLRLNNFCKGCVSFLCHCLFLHSFLYSKQNFYQKCLTHQP